MIWVLVYFAVGVLASRGMYRAVKGALTDGFVGWDKEDEVTAIGLVFIGILVWPITLAMMLLYKWVHLGDSKDGDDE